MSETGLVSVILFTAMIFGVGCATSTQPTPEVSDVKRQLVELQKVLGAQASKIEELNNKILLLKDRFDNKPDAVTAQTEIPLPTPQAPPVALVEPIGAPSDTKNSKSTNVEKLYQQAVSDAAKPTLNLLERDVDLMLKAHKDSPLTNNALFLLAQTHFDRGQFAQGATQFEKLYKTFPDGNKAVAALYRLGLCYEKMGHNSEAKEAFQNVMTVYPGSTEAIEAEKRLKMSGASEKGAQN